MSANSDHDREPRDFIGDAPDLTAFALGQLDDAERADVERQLAGANGDAAGTVEQMRRLAEEVRGALAGDHPASSAALRQTLIQRMGEPCAETVKPSLAAKPQSLWRRYAVEFVAASLILVLLAVLLMRAAQHSRELAGRVQSGNNLRQLQLKTGLYEESGAEASRSDAVYFRYQRSPDDSMTDFSAPLLEATEDGTNPAYGNHWHEATDSPTTSPSASAGEALGQPGLGGQNSAAGGLRGRATTLYYDSSTQSTAGAAKVPDPGSSLARVSGSNGTSPGGDAPFGDKSGGGKRSDGQRSNLYGAIPPRTDGQGQGQPVMDGFNKFKVPVLQGGAGEGRGFGREGGQGRRPEETADHREIPRAFHTFSGLPDQRPGMGGSVRQGVDQAERFFRDVGGGMFGGMMPGGPGSEQYAPILENGFILAQGIDALSTFSIDVDTASYANVRRFLTQEQLPPPDAVRLEELVNYFRYDYPQPRAGEPFSVNMEVAECPWQQKHLLLRVGLKGREIHHQERPVSNLVFLLDVSGSMADENKLPLLKQVLSMLVRELREDDRVSIVTYAGEAGLRLPPTTGNEQAKILAAIDALSASGSTNGSAGIELAYEQAQGYFRKEGTNRVILATDGDLNVGITDDESLVKLIRQKAAGGVFLTVLGFGEGNLKDAKMERLADNGNGLYAYIDSVREGRKVVVEQMSGSLVTIAKDVKIQIEFNPAQVQSYRLLGYENRVLTAPEFNDDKRDAGEIGAGHSVTALYELAPVGTPAESPGSAEPPVLRYQTEERIQGPGLGVQDGKLTEAAASGELLTLKLRYKEPEGQASKLSEYPLKNRGGKFNAASKDFQFAAAVASFGMHLRNSQFRGDGTLAATAEIAAGAIGQDQGGYRAEFVDLVRKAQSLGVK